MRIVADAVLLTCKTHGEPELHCRYCRSRLHERLASDVPCKGSGRKEAPAVLLGELARSVAAGRECENIS